MISVVSFAAFAFAFSRHAATYSFQVPNLNDIFAWNQTFDAPLQFCTKSDQMFF